MTAFFGGSGNQRGTAISVIGSDVYVAGQSGNAGLLLRYAPTLAAPVWNTAANNIFFNSLATSLTTVYPVGGAIPPTCGASDGAGDTEAKSALARYTPAGALQGCQSPNFFTYRGGESYGSVLLATEGASEVVYAAGQGEEVGGGRIRTILAKYDAAGTLLWKRRYGSGFSGGSGAQGMTLLNGFLYLAGYDQNNRAMLLKYDAAAQPPDSNPNVTGATFLTAIWSRTTSFSGFFQAVAALGNEIYVAGQTGSSGSENYLIEKYDEDGNLLWSQNFGGSGTDVLTGLVTVGGRLFAAGYTNRCSDKV